jgi:hypothetical protein
MRPQGKGTASFFVFIAAVGQLVIPWQISSSKDEHIPDCSCCHSGLTDFYIESHFNILIAHLEPRS